MTITPFLRTQAFDPELIQTMSEALTAACVTLGLTERSDPFTELVARRIIELAQRGNTRRDRPLFGRGGRVQG